VWQAISNVIDFGMPIEAAVAAPRIHHQHLPDEVMVEQDALTAQTDRELRAAGYTLTWRSLPHGAMSATAIARTKTGWRGTADPRNGGGALGD